MDVHLFATKLIFPCLLLCTYQPTHDYLFQSTSGRSIFRACPKICHALGLRHTTNLAAAPEQIAASFLVLRQTFVKSDTFAVPITGI